jgi:hypothetical protein
MSNTTRYSFTRVSGNSKTGPIPTTMSSRETCPDNCGLKSSGCYAEAGMVRMHWQKVGQDNPKSITIDQLAGHIVSLPKGQLWRMNVAGDLAHDNQVIDPLALSAIIRANKGKKGFTYTHHKVTGHDNPNAELVHMANNGGFTVNLSADTLQQADEYKALNIGPVVCILPMDCDKVTRTPAGNTVIQCPATYNDNLTCANCGICAVATRAAIIGFPVHGTGKNKAHKVFMMKKGA